MKRATRILAGLETGLTGIFALGAALLTVNEAIVRYVSPTSLPDWSAEVTIYLVGWAVMLGSSRLVRDKMHVSVDLLVETMSSANARRAEIFSCIFGIVVSCGIVYAGIKMVDFALLLGERSDSSIRFPMWLYYACIPVGFTLGGLQYLFRLWELLRGEAV